jgi:hypothetical protein
MTKTTTGKTLASTAKTLAAKLKDPVTGIWREANSQDLEYGLGSNCYGVEMKTTRKKLRQKLKRLLEDMSAPIHVVASVQQMQPKAAKRVICTASRSGGSKTSVGQ